MLLQQLCGINVVTFYAQAIFAEAGSDLDPGLSATLVSLATLAGNAAAVWAVDRTGRRPLLAASSLVMAAAMALLGTFFYLKENAGCEGAAGGGDHLSVSPPR